MRLNRRLRSLERQLAPPPPLECPACGLPLLGAGPVAIKVGWWSPDGPHGPRPAVP